MTTPSSIEISAATVEEAIQSGLEQLGLEAGAVDIDVLDAGSKGLFGLGSRLARVQLTVKDARLAVEEPPTASESAPAAATEAVKPARVEAEVHPYEILVPEAELTVEEGELVEVSRKVVSDLLEKMKIEASVRAGLRRAQDEQDEDTVCLNIEGDDLSVLIGRRSETLNALQYIASLIIGKQVDGWVPLVIDVQGYRARRERQLRQLARRMAEQAVQSGKRQMLEPMTAGERRIIHLELRSHPEVETESIGEEPNRKITIQLKRHA